MQHEQASLLVHCQKLSRAGLQTLSVPQVSFLLVARPACVFFVNVWIELASMLNQFRIVSVAVVFRGGGWLADCGLTWLGEVLCAGERGALCPPLPRILAPPSEMGGRWERCEGVRGRRGRDEAHRHPPACRAG